jgi:hypothetical protein
MPARSSNAGHIGTFPRWTAARCRVRQRPPGEPMRKGPAAAQAGAQSGSERDPRGNAAPDGRFADGIRVVGRGPALW